MSRIVTITGMEGCGKTVLMQNLATMCAMPQYGGYRTACLICDESKPEIQTVFRGSVIDRAYTLDRMFWSDDPATMFVPAKGIDNLYIAGVDTGEDRPRPTKCDTYEPPAEVLQNAFFDHLKNNAFFDVVFVEAGKILENSFSAAAVEAADLCLECVEVSMKGKLWFDAYHELVSVFRVKKGYTNGVLLVGIESWHKLHVKDTAPFFSLAPVIIPFCEEAGLGTEIGVPFILRKDGVQLMKNERSYLQKLESLYDYIAHKEPWRENITVDEIGNPIRLYEPAQRRSSPPQRAANRRGGRR